MVLVNIKLWNMQVCSLSIISNRHPSIKKVVPKLFPNAFHGYCAFHMDLNLNRKLENANIIPLFCYCSIAYTRKDFDKYMVNLKMIDSDITKYLINLGKEKWSRHHFSGIRYGIMTKNMSKSLNNVMRATREMLITMLVKHYHAKL